MRRVIFVFVVTLMTCVAIGGGVVGSIAWSERPPAFFPLDDRRATYQIGRMAGNYTVLYQPQANGPVSEVLVGSSRVVIEPYVGKKVRLWARFADHFSNRQCVMDHCHLIFGNEANVAVVIDIEAINEINVRPQTQDKLRLRVGLLSNRR